MSQTSFNRGLDDGACGEPERPGQDQDYYDGYRFAALPDDGPEIPEPEIPDPEPTPDDVAQYYQADLVMEREEGTP